MLALQHGADSRATQRAIASSTFVALIVIRAKTTLQASFAQPTNEVWFLSWVSVELRRCRLESTRNSPGQIFHRCAAQRYPAAQDGQRYKKSRILKNTEVFANVHNY